MTLSFLELACYHNVLNILRENAINLSSKPNDKLKQKMQTMPESTLWFWIHEAKLPVFICLSFLEQQGLFPFSNKGLGQATLKITEGCARCLCCKGGWPWVSGLGGCPGKVRYLIFGSLNQSSSLIQWIPSQTSSTSKPQRWGGHF